MKKMHGFTHLVVALAAIWVLAVVAGAQAQEKGGKKDAREKDKMKNEQAAKSDSKAAEVKYKPRAMTEKDLSEWTGGNPPGWSRGEKTGWAGAGAPPGQMKNHGEQELIHIYPHGSEDWDTKRREDWINKLEQSRVRILERIRTRGGMSREDEESAMISVESAAHEGAPLEHVEGTMNRAIDGGMRGRDIEKVTRALSYGADKNIDYNRLDRLIDKRMNEGETGDALALSIYKEIDEQHAGKPEEPVKKSWWQRLFGG
jgi:hypothetical protein